MCQYEAQGHFQHQAKWFVITWLSRRAPTPLTSPSRARTRLVQRSGIIKYANAADRVGFGRTGLFKSRISRATIVENCGKRPFFLTFEKPSRPNGHHGICKEKGTDGQGKASKTPCWNLHQGSREARSQRKPRRPRNQACKRF